MSGSRKSEDAAATSSLAREEEIPKYHPESKWQEPWKDPHLTLFDVHRQPRRIIDNRDHRVSLPLKVLSTEFQCPICLGYMKKTSIVMECLHRFCRECIQKCLRLGKKECPSCRIHIPSRRSLRPDPKFDLLIKHICGDLEELERQQEREIEMLNKSQHMNNAYTESRKRGMLAQAVHRKKVTGKSTLEQITMVGARQKAAGPPSIIDLEPSPLMEFLLRRHPQETRVDRLARECIRINHEATVSTLKIFLARKLLYAPSSHFQVLSTAGGSSVILDDSITLGEVQANLCDCAMGEAIVLQYRIFAPP